MAEFAVSIAGSASGNWNKVVGPTASVADPIWGLKTEVAVKRLSSAQATVLEGLKSLAVGDTVFFARGGPGRKKLGVWQNYPALDEVVETAVRDEYYFDSTPFWTNDTYPERFGFEVVTTQSSVLVKNMNPHLVAALQVSASVGGALVPLGNVPVSIAPSPPGTATGPTQAQKIVTQLSAMTQLSKQVLSSRRLEQGKLRALLLNGAKQGACAICGRTFRDRMLTASHIKRRSECTLQEGTDRHVVMLNCLAGCDVLFESGAIAVDASGGVIPAITSKATSDELALINGLVNPKVKVANHQQSQTYFDWHRKHVAKS